MIRTVLEMLSEPDRNFLLSLKRNEPDWSLFPISELQETVSNLLVVRWKLMNLSQMNNNQRAKSLSKLQEVLTDK